MRHLIYFLSDVVEDYISDIALEVSFFEGGNTMKAEVKRIEQPARSSHYGAVESGEYSITLIPESEEDTKIALRLHKSIEGIKDLPMGEVLTYFRSHPIKRMRPEISFSLTVAIKDTQPFV